MLGGEFGFGARWAPGWHGSWKCRWKLYDTRGKVVGIRNCAVSPSKKMDYQQAWAHFVKGAKRNEAQRPIGTRPLAHEAIQKAVQRVGLSGPAGAAAKLGIPRQTLESKIRRLGIDKYGRKRPTPK
jgi:DNA-binding NtrC family response regulator